jgi:acetyl-CoA acetyltransferase
VSRDDSTYGLRRSPIRIEALSTQRPSWPTWSQNPDIAVLPAQVDVGRDLWRRTTLTPADVDVAAIYDGFSFLALMWLEALGFCEIGEGGAYLEGGKRIALDGELPINPHGGQLSSGRMHGWGYVPEMCTQLWGEGGERQVAGSPEVALVACGGGVGVSAALLTRS